MGLVLGLLKGILDVLHTHRIAAVVVDDFLWGVYTLQQAVDTADLGRVSGLVDIKID
jgi:hypothetical protein